MEKLETPQLVPIEPVLRGKKNIFIVSGICFPLWLISSFIPARYNYSFFFSAHHLNMFFYMGTFLPLMYFFRWPNWKKLEQRRQLAAQDAAKQVKIPGSGYAAGIEPLHFVVSLRRSRKTLLISVIIIPVMVLLLGYLCYTNWLVGIDQMQVSHNGNWLIISIALDVFMLTWMLVTSMFGIRFSGQQKLIATESGVFYHNGLKLSFIAWDEVKLFAIVGLVIRGNGGLYELSSNQEIIRWAVIPGEVIDMNMGPAWLGAGAKWGMRADTPAEYRKCIEMLTAIIQQRTGLALYDLRVDSR